MLLLIPAIRADVTADRALLPVKVNEIPRGEVLAAIDGENVLVPRTFAEELGIPLEKVASVQIEGEPYVSLSSLAPELTFKFDPNELILALTVDPKYLERQVLQLRRGATGIDRGGDPSIFLNYALTGSDLKDANFFGELGGGRKQRFFTTGFSGRSGEFVRGLTSFNVDSPSRIRRFTAGDRVIGTDLLGGTFTMGGVTVSREFTLQPYLIRSPSLDLTGTATTPSTVEVYVNGQLTSRIPVAPGVFTLRDLPVTGGLGTTRLVVRDVFGRESVQEGSFYYSTVALRKGLSEYTFSAGVLRNDLTKSFEYDNPAAYGQYRRGMTDVVTLGGRMEGSEDVVSGGPRLTLATRFGDIDLSVAGSRTDDFSGNAGSAAYRFNAPRYSFGVSTVRRSDHYATLSLRPDIERVVSDTNAFAAATIGWFNVGLLASRSELRDAQPFERVALQGNAPIGRWGNLFLSVGRVRQGDRTDPEILAGITIGLGHHTTADVQVQRTAGLEGVRAEIRKPLGTANGLGYALQTDSLTDTHFSAVQYQTSFGRYEIAADPQRLREATASIAGGLVYIGGALIPTRPLQDSFALARVGVPNVRVYASNQEIGRTNRRGDLLITSLLAHYANELHIADKDIPMDYEVADTNVTVVPPTRGGVLANFPVKRLQSFSGKVQMIIIGEPFPPSLGLVEVNAAGETMTLPLGREGEFYAENMTAGTYPAQLNIGVVTCKFNLVIPSTEAAFTDLGVISCVP